MKHSIKVKKAKHEAFLKSTSMLLVFSFLFQELAMANPELPRIAAQKFFEGTGSKTWARKMLPLIPDSVATLEDAYQAPGAKKTVILLQDAHTNNSGQFNAAKTLDLIFKKDPIRYVFLEAGTGDESLSFLRKYASEPKRQQVASSFVMQGKLQGTEYLDVTSDHNFVLWGVEDMSLYAKSVEAYRAVVKDREKFQGYLSKIETTVKTLKPKIYNPLLLSFDQKHQKFQKEELSLTDYFEALTLQAKNLGLSMGRYPHLGILSSLKNMESKIDFKKASEQQRQAVASLSEAEQKDLLQASKEDQALSKASAGSRPSQKAFFALLEEKLKTKAASYGELFKYFQYLKECSKLSAKDVIQEQRSLEKEVFAALAGTDDERNLVLTSRNLGYLKNLFDLKMTPEEFIDYLNDRKSFDIQQLTGFLNRKIMDLETYYERAIFLEDGYEDMIRNSETFYTLTYQRDQKFIENLTQKMDAENQDQAILVTGGYHSPNLKQLLKQRGISYINLTPAVYQETNQKRYEKILFESMGSMTQSVALPMTKPLAMRAGTMSPTRAGDGARFAEAIGARLSLADQDILQHRYDLLPSAFSLPPTSQGARLAEVFEPYYSDENKYVEPEVRAQLKKICDEYSEMLPSLVTDRSEGDFLFRVKKLAERQILEKLGATNLKSIDPKQLQSPLHFWVLGKAVVTLQDFDSFTAEEAWKAVIAVAKELNRKKSDYVEPRVDSAKGSRLAQSEARIALEEKGSFKVRGLVNFADSFVYPLSKNTDIQTLNDVLGLSENPIEAGHSVYAVVSQHRSGLGTHLLWLFEVVGTPSTDGSLPVRPIKFDNPGVFTPEQGQNGLDQVLNEFRKQPKQLNYEYTRFTLGEEVRVSGVTASYDPRTRGFILRTSGSRLAKEFSAEDKARLVSSISRAFLGDREKVAQNVLDVARETTFVDKNGVPQPVKIETLISFAEEHLGVAGAFGDSKRQAVKNMPMFQTVLKSHIQSRQQLTIQKPAAGSRLASNQRTIVKDESILAWSSKHQKSLDQILLKFVKEYDLRGFDGSDDINFPQEVDAELLRWIGRAFGTAEFESPRHGRTVRLNAGDSFVIAGDNGPSTQAFKDALTAGLRDTGINVIDLGVTVSGELYKSISNLGAQGGLYVTRSHVEVGTNGAKPNIGGITLYGDMLQAVRKQILKAEYAKAETEGTLDVSEEIRGRSRGQYLDSLRNRYQGLAQLLKATDMKVALNLNSGSATEYGDFFREIFGADVTLLKSQGDPWATQGLADPTRKDEKALAHPEANIVQYSKEHPEVYILSVDLDVDRVSLLQNGELYLGDSMFYPVIQYQLTMNPYKDLLKNIYPDSRMKTEFGDLVRHFGGTAKIHPKGHSKVKATIDGDLSKTARSKNYASVAEFLEEFPGFQIAQAEYSLHFFLTNEKGEAFDDAIDFAFFWLTVFAKIKQRHDHLEWRYADYIYDLYAKGAMRQSYQIKEQRTPMPDEAKTAVMTAMTEEVKRFFRDRDDFKYVDSWEADYESSMAPFTLVNVEGVYHLFTPTGEIFWGQSNTSPKVAFGTQATSMELANMLAKISAALLIRSRRTVYSNMLEKIRKTQPAGSEKTVIAVLPMIDPLETVELFTAVLTPEELLLSADQKKNLLEERLTQEYPTAQSALEALVNLAPSVAGSRLALPTVDPTRTKAWKELKKNFEAMRQFHLRDHVNDAGRVRRLSREFVSGDARLSFDFSRNLITEDVLKNLYALAKATKLSQSIEKMFSGDIINGTEKRAVLHTALRAPEDAEILVDGKNVVPDVHRVLDQVKRFSEDVNSGAWKGMDGDEITDIVNIGIGGSDLGGVMDSEALRAFATGKVRVHYVSNVDPTDFNEKVIKAGLNPKTTIFIIASKTFTTEETMTNANLARQWFLNKTGNNSEAIKKHFVAVSTAAEKVKAFGIDLANMFEFWDWVGGRYSKWSAVGLSVATYIGYDNFKEILAGAHDMDEHFRTAPLEENIPVMKALLGVWYRNFYGAQTHVVLPYSQYMNRLPAYLQQLFMESNGKSTSRLGKRIKYLASSIWLGEPGTNGQHSFYQLIHQIFREKMIIPADFIGVAVGEHDNFDSHQKLLANFLAQTKALAVGKTREEVAKDDQDPETVPHRVFEGNNPTNSILLKRLTPRTFGALIAMYEHQAAVEGFLMNIFSFDQWGVELGKVQAGPIRDELLGKSISGTQDPATASMIARIKEYQALSDQTVSPVAGSRLAYAMNEGPIGEHPSVDVSRNPLEQDIDFRLETAAGHLWMASEYAQLEGAAPEGFPAKTLETLSVSAQSLRTSFLKKEAAPSQANFSHIGYGLSLQPIITAAEALKVTLTSAAEASTLQANADMLIKKLDEALESLRGAHQQLTSSSGSRMAEADRLIVIFSQALAASTRAFNSGLTQKSLNPVKVGDRTVLSPRLRDVRNLSLEALSEIAQIFSPQLNQFTPGLLDALRARAEALQAAQGSRMAAVEYPGGFSAVQLTRDALLEDWPYFVRLNDDPTKETSVVFWKISRDGKAFAVAIENPKRQTIYTYPYAANVVENQIKKVRNYWVDTMSYLYERVKQDGRLLEWVESSLSSHFLKAWLHGPDAEYSAVNGNGSLFERQWRYEGRDGFPHSGVSRTMGSKTRLFQLDLKDVVFAEKPFSGQSVARSSFSVMPKKEVAVVGLGTITAQVARFLRDLGFDVVAYNRTAVNTTSAQNDGLKIGLLNPSHVANYSGLSTVGTFEDRVKAGYVSAVVEGLDGEIGIDVASESGERKREDVSVSKFYRGGIQGAAPMEGMGILGEASKNGVPVLYQGGSDLNDETVAIVNPSLLSLLGIPFDIAHGTQMENMSLSCNGTSTLALISALALLGDEVESASVHIKFIRRLKDFPQADYSEDAIKKAQSGKSKHHHTDEDIQTMIRQLQENLPAELRGKVVFNFDTMQKEKEGETVDVFDFTTHQADGLQSLYHKVVGTILIKKKDGTVMSADEFRELTRRSPNTAALNVPGLLTIKDGEVVDLDQKKLNGVLSFITDKLRFLEPAISPFVVEDLPDGKGIAIGALTFQKHNVLPGIIAWVLLRTGMVVDAEEAVRRAMEITGMDILKRKLETNSPYKVPVNGHENSNGARLADASQAVSNMATGPVNRFRDQQDQLKVIAQRAVNRNPEGAADFARQIHYAIYSIEANHFKGAVSAIESALTSEEGYEHHAFLTQVVADLRSAIANQSKSFLGLELAASRLENLERSHGHTLKARITSARNLLSSTEENPFILLSEARAWREVVTNMSKTQSDNSQGRAAYFAGDIAALFEDMARSASDVAYAQMKVLAANGNYNAVAHKAGAYHWEVIASPDTRTAIAQAAHDGATLSLYLVRHGEKEIEILLSPEQGLSVDSIQRMSDERIAYFPRERAADIRRADLRRALVERAWQVINRYRSIPSDIRLNLTYLAQALNTAAGSRLAEAENIKVEARRILDVMDTAARASESPKGDDFGVKVIATDLENLLKKNPEVVLGVLRTERNNPNYHRLVKENIFSLWWQVERREGMNTMTTKELPPVTDDLIGWPRNWEALVSGGSPDGISLGSRLSAGQAAMAQTPVVDYTKALKTELVKKLESLLWSASAGTTILVRFNNPSRDGAATSNQIELPAFAVSNPTQNKEEWANQVYQALNKQGIFSEGSPLSVSANSEGITIGYGSRLAQSGEGFNELESRARSAQSMPRMGLDTSSLGQSQLTQSTHSFVAKDRVSLKVSEAGRKTLELLGSDSKRQFTLEVYYEDPKISPQAVLIATQRLSSKQIKLSRKDGTAYEPKEPTELGAAVLQGIQERGINLPDSLEVIADPLGVITITPQQETSSMQASLLPTDSLTTPTSLQGGRLADNEIVQAAGRKEEIAKALGTLRSELESARIVERRPNGTLQAGPELNASEGKSSQGIEARIESLRQARAIVSRSSLPATLEAAVGLAAALVEGAEKRHSLVTVTFDGVDEPFKRSSRFLLQGWQAQGFAEEIMASNPMRDFLNGDIVVSVNGSNITVKLVAGFSTGRELTQYELEGILVNLTTRQATVSDNEITQAVGRWKEIAKALGILRSELEASKIHERRSNGTPQAGPTLDASEGKSSQEIEARIKGLSQARAIVSKSSLPGALEAAVGLALVFSNKKGLLTALIPGLNLSEQVSHLRNSAAVSEFVGRIVATDEFSRLPNEGIVVRVNGPSISITSSTGAPASTDGQAGGPASTQGARMARNDYWMKMGLLESSLRRALIAEAKPFFLQAEQIPVKLIQQAYFDESLPRTLTDLGALPADLSKTEEIQSAVNAIQDALLIGRDMDRWHYKVVVGAEGILIYPEIIKLATGSRLAEGGERFRSTRLTATVFPASTGPSFRDRVREGSKQLSRDLGATMIGVKGGPLARVRRGQISSSLRSFFEGLGDFVKGTQSIAVLEGDAPTVFKLNKSGDYTVTLPTGEVLSLDVRRRGKRADVELDSLVQNAKSIDAAVVRELSQVAGYDATQRIRLALSANDFDLPTIVFLCFVASQKMESDNLISVVVYGSNPETQRVKSELKRLKIDHRFKFETSIAPLKGVSTLILKKPSWDVSPVEGIRYLPVNIPEGGALSASVVGASIVAARVPLNGHLSLNFVSAMQVLSGASTSSMGVVEASKELLSVIQGTANLQTQERWALKSLIQTLASDLRATYERMMATMTAA